MMGSVGQKLVRATEHLVVVRRDRNIADSGGNAFLDGDERAAFGTPHRKRRSVDVGDFLVLRVLGVGGFGDVLECVEACRPLLFVEGDEPECKVDAAHDARRCGFGDCRVGLRALVGRYHLLRVFPHPPCLRRSVRLSLHSRNRQNGGPRLPWRLLCRESSVKEDGCGLSFAG
jgi:hypothetical protein